MHRLKSRPQFQATLAGGIVSRTAHFALHRAALDDVAPVSLEAPAKPGVAGSPALFGVSDVWVGAMVPKRWARRAVTRNAVKRQIYSVSTLFEPRLPHAAHLVRLRNAFDRSQYISASSDALKRAVRTELEQLFGRIAIPAPLEPAA